MSKKNYREVGRVEALIRYPVKSMAGEMTPATKIGWHGQKGDRRFAFMKINDKSGFPWLTARDLPGLVTYSARYSDPAEPERSAVIVATPQGVELDVRDPALLEELMNATREPLHLVQLYGGIFDANDLSLITEESIAQVSNEAGVAPDPRRFRPNIVVSAPSGGSFPEDKWVGELLVFGERPDSARVRVYRKDVRCVVVNVDPDHGERRGELLSVVARSRKNLLGVYAGAERPGTIAAADPVFIQG